MEQCLDLFTAQEEKKEQCEKGTVILVSVVSWLSGIRAQVSRILT